MGAQLGPLPWVFVEDKGTRVYNPCAFDIESTAESSLVSHGWIRYDFVIAAIPSLHPSNKDYQHLRPMLLSLLIQTQPVDIPWDTRITLVVRKLVPGLKDSMELRMNFSTASAATLEIPTILIVCPSPKLLFPGLETLLRADTLLRIEIQRGSVQLHSNENSGCRGYEREVSMGRSIGCPGGCYSGTFGGWVYDLETEERFGVTAGHVCLAAHAARVYEFPLIITEGIAICQPSDTDYQCIAQDLAQAKLKSYAKSEEIGFCHPKMEERRLEDDARHESWKALDYARHLGRIQYGVVDIDNCPNGVSSWKDYGLIAVVPERQGGSGYGYINEAQTESALEQICLQSSKQISL
ncbi:hypothetical protein BGX38DRAFT_410719 [Terfezia claveryi]|nr:hypothetical protein BGX38DRAFT_410719 [Terfezia claveryi]